MNRPQKMQGGPSGTPAPSQGIPADLSPAWERLKTFQPDFRRLDRNRVFMAARKDPVCGAIDMLRTRLRRAMSDRGWTRLGITSPNKGCGKTFLSCNLAFSFARERAFRTLLIDMDLRRPSVGQILGMDDAPWAGDMIGAPEKVIEGLLRIDQGLAVLANDRPVPASAEFLQDPLMTQALAGLRTALAPDLILYDLPPILACDDVLAFQDELDGILLVARGGLTTSEEIRQVERLIEDKLPLVAVVFNEAEDASSEPYRSYYA